MKTLLRKISLITLLTMLLAYSFAQRNPGDGLVRQERVNRSMSRLAKEQAKSSPASRAFWGGLAIVIIIIGIISISSQSSAKRKRQEERRLEYEKRQAEIIEKQKEIERINLEQLVNVKNELDTACYENPYLKEYLEKAYSYLESSDWKMASIEYKSVKGNYERFVTLFNKYGDKIGPKIYKGETWVGMSEEELIDAKGRPTKIEIEQLKTKTKRILIYGNKSSGDVFTFVNGEMVKLIDR